jgi:YVTN family beta-propeller protein
MSAMASTPVALVCVALLALFASGPAAAQIGPLEVEAKIPLGAVSGRIDHLAYDAGRERLYVAELGNDTIGIVDLKGRRVIRTVAGFDEPQGIAYESRSDTVYVASGGDGSLRMLSGADFAPVGSLALGKDADNVRIDRDAHRVYVGHGDGALAVIDAATRKRIADIPLQGHPESFQLDVSSDRVFVNVPDARQIAVVSRKTMQQVATWYADGFRSNYPLALDSQSGRALAVFRRPARIQAYETATGRQLGGIEACADSDDIFIDAKRHRAYVICGQGVVDTLETSANGFRRSGRLTTSEGSRTGLWIPELDRLVVAIRATRGEDAAVWVVRPNP